MTKVRTYRIDIDDNSNIGDAIVIADDGCMTSQHLGTSASLDVGECCGNVPVLDVCGKLPNASMPSSVMKVCVYDPNGKGADVYDYCNFDNTPEIPVVNDPTVTFTQGCCTLGSISLNQSGDTTINIPVGGFTGGKAIDINNNIIELKYDTCNLDINDNNCLYVVDYANIKCGAAAGATAVQANDLATVAMTGNYCDLINKPEIPSAQVQSDWEQCNTNLPDYIKNKPTIGNATITVQKNGTDVDCFTLNQTANKCLNITLNKCDVGLNNVDNTSDADKPVSTAVCEALSCKQDNITDLGTIRCNACAGKCASDTIAAYGDIVTHNVCEFATSSQGGKADTAVQPLDLCVVATSGKYCDLTGTPTIPTDNCQLANSCGFTSCTGTVVASDLTPYAKTCNLCTVATSGKYCDLTGTPAIPGVIDNLSSCSTSDALSANQGRELDARICNLEARGRFLSNWNATTGLPETNPESLPYAYRNGDYFFVTVVGVTNYKPNGSSYTGTASTTLETGDVAIGDLYTYDGTNWILQLNHNVTASFSSLSGQPEDNANLCVALGCKADVSSLCSVATSGQYCDLSGTPIIPATLSSGTGICIDSNNNVNAKNTYIINEDAFTVTYTKTKGVAPYNTCYCYTDVCINPSCGIKWDEGATYIFNLNTKVSTSACRNVRFKIGDGDYIPLMGTTSAAAGSTYFVKSAIRQFQYSTKYEACGALHVFTDSNSTYSAMTQAEIDAGTGTTGRTITPACLKYAIEYYSPTDNCQLANGCGYITNSDLSGYSQTCDLCTVATSGKYCDLSGTPSLATVATTGLYCDLQSKPTIPTKVSDLTNDCNYITKSVNNLDNYTPSNSLATVATSGAYCDLTGAPSLACVATSGCYDDLCGKPNLGVYQTTACMVCTLSGADHSHYPSAKTVADALSCAGAGDMLSTVYDPNNKAADAFNYCNFINTPLLCTVATSGKYCDLTGLPTIPSALTAGNGICISSNAINVVCDNSTIKKDANNKLYADFTGLATTTDLQDYAKSCDLSAIAYSGCYCDLVDAPTLCTVATSGKYCDLTGTPSLCTVATSGKYCDLSGTPSLCTVATSGQYCDLTGAPSLCTVATSGQYCDLTGTPIIPTVNTKTFCLSGTSDLTTAQAAYDWYKAGNTPIIQCGSYTYILEGANSNNVKFVSTNQSRGTQGNSRTTVATSAITLCKSSDTINCISTSTTYGYNFLETDRNYSTPYTPQYDGSPATKKYVDDHVGSQWGCITGTLCDQTDLQGVLDCRAQCCDIPTDNCQLANGCGYLTSASLATVATTGCYCDLLGTPSLCTVATSGQYCDLTGTPSLCTVATSGKYCDLTGQPTIPTDNCQLANGCGYVTSSSIDTKTFTLSSTSDTTNATAALTHINGGGNAIILYNNVSYTLTSKSSSSLVFKGPSSVSAGNSDTTINVPTLTFTVSSNAVTTITSNNTSLGKYLETDRNYSTPLTPSYNGSPTSKKYVDDCLACKANTSSLCTVATSGKYCDLTGLPTIPTNNNQLTNGCGYTTCTGTLTNGSLVTINGCCLVGSGDICIQGGVTSVNGCTGAVCVCEVPSGGSCGQVLQKTTNGCDWATISLDAGDMMYCDFNFVSKSGSSITLDLSSCITPSSDFTVNKPTTVKEGQAYVLRVTSGATAYTMTLGTGVNNPRGENLALTPNATDQFVFWGTSSSALELQKSEEIENIYVTQTEYDNLPSSKISDGKTYFIYE